MRSRDSDPIERPEPTPTPLPVSPPPVPPFQPATYTVRLDHGRAGEIRSRGCDTLRLSTSVAVNQAAPSTQTKDLGDHGTGDFPIGLTFSVHISSPNDVLVFNYLLLNLGHQDWGTVSKALDSAGTALAAAGAKAAAAAIGGEVGAVVGAEIGTMVVPVIGTAIAAVGAWLATDLVGMIFANCDGPVAAEQAVLLGKDLWAQSQRGPIYHQTYHPGTDSSHGCGANSQYMTFWSITRQ